MPRRPPKNTPPDQPEDPSRLLGDGTAAPEPVKRSGQSSRRFGNARNALSLISGAKRSLDKRIELWREISERADRVPPMGGASREEGLAWTSDVDWGGMERGLNSVKEPLYNLATQPKPPLRLSCIEPMDSAAKVYERAAELDERMLRQWGEYGTEMEMMVDHMAATGIGIMHFSHPRSWIARALHPGNLITPKTAKVNPASWPWAAVVHRISVDDLLEKLDDPEAAAKVGWNIPAVRAAVRKVREHVDGTGTVATDGLNDAEPAEIRINDLKSKTGPGSGAPGDSDELPGFILYVREHTGRVSERRIFADDNFCREHGYLFEDPDRHDSMQRLFNTFPLSLGSGYLHRVRGYGAKMLPFHDAENMMLNRGVDSTWLTSGIFLQGEADDMKRMQSMGFGPITFMPSGISLPQQSIGDPTRGLMGMLNEMRRMAEDHGRASGAQTGTASPERSATEARIDWQDARQLTTFQVQRFNECLDAFQAERWRRLTNPDITEVDPGGPEARELQRQLRDIGLTEDKIAKKQDGDRKMLIEGRARKIFGGGSQVDMFLAMRDLMPMFGQFTKSGQRSLIRYMVSARLGGQEWADEFMGAETTLDPQDDVLTMEQRMVQLENGVLIQGETRLTPGGRDVHAIHAAGHTQLAVETVDRHTRGELPKQVALQRVTAIYDHARQHIALMAQDPLLQDIVKDLVRQWADMENLTRQWTQQLQAEAARQQQEQQQAMMEELRNPRLSVADQQKILTEEAKRELMVRKTETEIELMRQEAEALMSIKQRESQFNRADMLQEKIEAQRAGLQRSLSLDAEEI